MATETISSTRVLRLIGDLVNEHSPHNQPPAEATDGLHLPGQPVQYQEDLAEQQENPTDWPTLRGTPDYRPLNRHVDLSLRPNGSNAIEFVIVNIMLNGVLCQGYIRTLWRAMGSPMKSYFRYEIGGLY